MKKWILTVLVLFIIIPVMSQQSFYDFTVNDIQGNPFPLSQLKGKKVLVVNTASRCGFTPQYRKLQSLYEKYGGDKFVIIGFPANNFLYQEPGSNAQIAEFCEKNYGVTFPMMEKISVRGSNMHPLYKWLTSRDKNGVLDSKVTWNFQKYLIDENGKLADKIEPSVEPDNERIVNWIQF